MSTAPNQEEFYKKLLGQLEDTAKFPHLYLYKFIVPTSKEKIAEVINKFDNLGATIETKESKNGKYTSISIRVKMKTAIAIIEKYKEVGKVEGIISL